MRSPGELLENHTVVVRDGRIIDVLPREVARERYAPAQRWDRPDHVLLPGLVDARAHLLPDAPNVDLVRHIDDAALFGMAAMLRAGTTCFCSTGNFPAETAAVAAAQGMRAVIGIPLAEGPSTWATGECDYLTEALRFRDDYLGHPLVDTAFAPMELSAIGDGTFGRIATLVDELDATVLVSMHESAAEIDDCVRRHGVRPIERLHALGLLTPALCAANLVSIVQSDLELAERGGIAVALCIGSDMLRGFGAPPVSAWLNSRLRLGLGSGHNDGALAPDLWSELRLFTLLAGPASTGGLTSAGVGTSAGVRTSAPGPTGAAANGSAGLAGATQAWSAIAAVTCGAAAALGLDTDLGTIETGKWADLCCVDLRSPAMQGSTLPAADRVLYGAGRDAVSDVWVAGRHLLDAGALTHLDWPALVERVSVKRSHIIFGEFK